MDPQKTAFLLRKAWTLYSVTPLYRFRRARLRDYARLLSAFIAAERHRGLAVAVGAEMDIAVRLSSLAELRGTDLDQAALLVQVRGLVIGTGLLRAIFAVVKRSVLKESPKIKP